MLSEQLITEIDATLDRLICNAEAIANIDLKTLSDQELEAFQKTQDSLIHHLLHVDERLKTEQGICPDQRSVIYKIAAKRRKFERLNSPCKNTVANNLNKKKSILLKRRKKRFFAAG
ncbi:MAG: hypothetical protein FJZ64_03655 [Chlamydiae bacterium]|nr:hypothetical protein [Chlamydiota bacterium]